MDRAPNAAPPLALEDELAWAIRSEEMVRSGKGSTRVFASSGCHDRLDDWMHSVPAPGLSDNKLLPGAAIAGLLAISFSPRH